MTERRRPNGLSPLPHIPNSEGSLPTDKTTLKKPIDSMAAFRSMAAFYRSLSFIDDPVVNDSAYNDRFVPLLYHYASLQPGDIVTKNNFWLEPVTSWPKKFPPTDTTSIVGQLDNQTVILQHTTEPTDLVLLEEHIVSGERYLGHAHDTRSGKERAIRPGFWYMDELEEELATIKTLDNLGYPVPQNATAHQLFLPWLDTITYDWIPGKDLGSILEEKITSGNRDEAMSIAKLFGQHLKEVWEPLLEDPLPDGSVYHFPDNAIWNFIYTGQSSPREAFVRIDVGSLSTDASPVGSARYLEGITRDLAVNDSISNYTGNLMYNIRQAFETSKE